MLSLRPFFTATLAFLICLGFLSAVSPAAAQGQGHRVAGTVTDATDNLPLPGVNIVVKGTTIGTTSNAEGEYSLSAPSPQDTLVFSFVGYQRQEIPINGRSTVDVALQGEVLVGEELVVTGYQTQNKADVTGSVSVVDAAKVQEVNSANLSQSLQGRVAGLNVQSSGAPGGGDAVIRIRGYSTAFGNQDPLFIIDGVPTKAGIRSINPRDIESIQVLKDASAASVYGARAANGVIVITTKQGSGDLRVSYDSYVGVQDPREIAEVLNARQWGEVWYRAQRNSGVENPTHPQYSFEPTADGVNVILPEYIDDNPADGDIIPAADTDWGDAVYDPALEQSHTLSLTKGTDNASVAATGSYFRQDGTVTETWFDRYTLRVNSDYTPMEGVRIGENFTVMQFNEVRNPGGVTTDALFQHPLVPVYKEEPSDAFAGPTFGLGDRLNPVGVMHRERKNTIHNWRVFGSAFVEVEPVSQLTLKSTIGLDYSALNQRAFQPRFDEGTQARVQNELFTRNNWGFNWTWTNTANYKQAFGNHFVEVLGGVEAVSQKSEGFNALRRNFLIDEDEDFRYLGAGTGSQTNDGFGAEAALFSLFSKVDYSYKDRYMASATLRRDMSSRLGEENSTAIFPAFSLGWRLSDESFLEPIEALSNLKVRVGWGQTGGQGIGDFVAFSAFAFSPEFSIYDIDGSQTSAETGFFRQQIGNPNLQWERTTEYNVGVDLGLFDNRVTVAADYFIKDTEELLLQPVRLAAQGEGNPPFINAGSVDNRGLEMEVGYLGTVGSELEFDVTGTLSVIRNTVEALTEGRDFLTGAEGNRIQPGHPVSAFYGWVYDGLFQTEEEVEAHADQGFADPADGLGRMRFRDLNDDGVINDQDRRFIGNPHPDFTYGLNIDLTYQSFDFSVFLQGEQGRDIFNAARRQLDFPSFNFNFGANTLDAWTPENRDTDIPRLTASDANNELRVSSYYVEDGSYLKIDRVTLGYTLPSSLTERFRTKQARIYFQTQNLLTITGYSGTDPELGGQDAFNLGIDRNLFPHARKLTVGVNLTF
jgi:TonB-linked SusC/RagA family outer membrane protein